MKRTAMKKGRLGWRRKKEGISSALSGVEGTLSLALFEERRKKEEEVPSDPL